jgi:hypothetical protein
MTLSQNFVDPFAPFLGEYKVYIQSNQYFTLKKHKKSFFFSGLTAFWQKM